MRKQANEEKAMNIVVKNNEVVKFCKEDLKKVMAFLKDVSQVESAYAIGGSTAAWIYGIGLGREIGDIDIIVSVGSFKKMYHVLRNMEGFIDVIQDMHNGYKNPTIKFTTKSSPVPINLVGVSTCVPAYEIGNYGNVVTLDNLLYAKHSLNRDKDKGDIKIIEEFIKNLNK